MGRKNSSASEGGHCREFVWTKRRHGNAHRDLRPIQRACHRRRRRILGRALQGAGKRYLRKVGRLFLQRQQDNNHVRRRDAGFGRFSLDRKGEISSYAGTRRGPALSALGNRLQLSDEQYLCRRRSRTTQSTLTTPFSPPARLFILYS